MRLRIFKHCVVCLFVTRRLEPTCSSVVSFFKLSNFLKQLLTVALMHIILFQSGDLEDFLNWQLYFWTLLLPRDPVSPVRRLSVGSFASITFHSFLPVIGSSYLHLFVGPWPLRVKLLAETEQTQLLCSLPTTSSLWYFPGKVPTDTQSESFIGGPEAQLFGDSDLTDIYSHENLPDYSRSIILSMGNLIYCWDLSFYNQFDEVFPDVHWASFRKMNSTFPLLCYLLVWVQTTTPKKKINHDILTDAT